MVDFVLSYAAVPELPPGKSTLNAECGGRGDGKFSVSYSVMMGEKADTNILLFDRDDDRNLMSEDETSIAQ